MKRFNIKVFLIAVSLVMMPLTSSANANANEEFKKEFKGKAVLVTGATSGIGQKIAETLAARGIFVYAGARKQSDIDRLNKNENMQGVRLDVTKSEDIAAAVEVVTKAGRGLHGLVNNAGVFIYAPLIEVAEDELKFQMDVNVYGPYRVTKAFAPLIIESRGRISNIGSIAGFNSSALFGPYSMSKYAVEAFTDALAAEMTKFGVQVSVVEPGNFNSKIMLNMQQRLSKLKKQNQTTQYQQEYERMVGFTQVDRSQHKDPTVVAEAVFHALFSEQPKRRYLAVPDQREAKFAMSALMRTVAQVNHQHEYSLSRDQLMDLLEAQIRKLDTKAVSQGE